MWEKKFGEKFSPQGVEITHCFDLIGENHVCLSVCLSVCLFVCLSVCLFVCLSVLCKFSNFFVQYKAAGVRKNIVRMNTDVLI